MWGWRDLPYRVIEDLRSKREIHIFSDYLIYIVYLHCLCKVWACEDIEKQFLDREDCKEQAT